MLSVYVFPNVDSKNIPLPILILLKTTDGEGGYLAAVERLPALHYIVDFMFWSFWIMGFIVEL